MKPIFFLCLAMMLRPAHAELCDASEHYCGYFPGSQSRSSGGAPTHGGKVRINPSAVPIEKGLGLEAILFDGGADFAIVKGLGRVGAAISPSNSEETFFGPPGIELPEDMLERKIGKHKYPAHKITLATSFNLLNNNNSGLSRFLLNFGVMGKYNQFTHAVTPGAGVTGIAGPFTYGYSVFRDQTQVDYARYGLATKPVTNYFVETYSVGAFLDSLAVDYSVLRMVTNDVATSSVVTGTLMISKSLITVAMRKESSTRPVYNYDTKLLEAQTDKSEWFGGFQIGVLDHLMVGLFYNYYLLREVSFGAVMFF